MAKRTIVTDEQLQQVWEDAFVVGLFSGNSAKGTKKINVHICKDAIRYWVWDVGFPISDHATMAEAVSAFNDL